MPLSDSDKHLLHELYDAPYSSNTIAAQNGYAISPFPIHTQTSLKQQLEAAIADIDADETKVTRVSEILAKYKDLDLDPSNIDRNGYSLRYKRSIRTLTRTLYTYTGIWVGTANSNQTPLG